MSGKKMVVSTKSMTKSTANTVHPGVNTVHPDVNTTNPGANTVPTRQSPIERTTSPVILISLKISESLPGTSRLIPVDPGTSRRQPPVEPSRPRCYHRALPGSRCDCSAGQFKYQKIHVHSLNSLCIVS